MPKPGAILQLLRPGNLAIAGLAVLVGSSGSWRGTGWAVALAAASAMAIAGAGNALNDVFDIEADRINRPRRPLPMGTIGRRFAYYLSIVLYLIGIGLGFLASPANGALAVLASALLWLYAARGKRLGLLGNLLVSLAGGLAFVYGGVAARQPWPSLIPAAFALLMHLAREMVKDVQDLEGDSRIGARTTAVVLGPRRTMAAASGALALLILLTPVPFLMHIYTWRYLAAVLLGVDPMLGFLIKDMLSGPGRERLGTISFYLKINMLLGLMAICLGL